MIDHLWLLCVIRMLYLMSVVWFVVCSTTYSTPSIHIYPLPIHPSFPPHSNPRYSFLYASLPTIGILVGKDELPWMYPRHE